MELEPWRIALDERCLDLARAEAGDRARDSKAWPVRVVQILD